MTTHNTGRTNIGAFEVRGIAKQHGIAAPTLSDRIFVGGFEFVCDHSGMRRGTGMTEIAELFNCAAHVEDAPAHLDDCYLRLVDSVANARFKWRH